MVRRHQPREGFYVVTVDGCHKLLESLSSVNGSESIGHRPILSQRIPGYRGYSCALCIAGVEKGLARPCVQEANPSRRYKLRRGRFVLPGGYSAGAGGYPDVDGWGGVGWARPRHRVHWRWRDRAGSRSGAPRSEEHTSELQSP